MFVLTGAIVQLPFRFAVPMIALSALLHWLISQSIFLAAVSEYDIDGSLIDAFAIATCGYSPIGMIFVLMVGGAMILILAVAAYLPMDRGMPVVGSCSAAIAANCRVNWEKQGFGGLDHISLGAEARQEMLKGPIVWGALVSDGERLRFDRGDGKSPALTDRAPVYGFVSAASTDWRERVREPMPAERSKG
jgi:hypothetical protein